MNKKTKFLPVDIVILIYLACLSFLIIIFKKNQPDWLFYLFFNFIVGLAVYLIVKFLSNKNKFAHFFRHWYPMLFYTILYEETRHLIHLVFPNFFDPLLNKLELNLLGVYPTVWLEKIVSFPLNEYMMFSYFFYYFLPLILGAGLYFSRKIVEFDRFVFTSSVGFYLCYFGFIFFPVEGPRFALASFQQIELKGFIFTPLAQYVIKVAGLHGGCMPSSHCMLAFVVLVYSFRYHKTIFYILAPLILSLFFATVYGRFHYATDVIVGILVALICIPICDKISYLWERKQKALLFEKELQAVEIPS